MEEPLVWTDKLSMGVDEIDAQHKRLLDLVNEVYNALDTDHAAGERALGDLRSFVSEHFGAEEELMREKGYPGLDEHRTEHLRLIRDLAGVHPATCGLPRTRVYLKAWLVDHVLGLDFKFAEFLKKED